VPLFRWLAQAVRIAQNSLMVTRLTPADTDAIVSVLADAFYDYPVMRFVLGPAPDYDRRLPILVGLFVAGRVLRGEPLLGVRDDAGALIGAAIMSIASGQETPAALVAKREATWTALGDDARLRYEAYGNACQPFNPQAYHHHLNMIGVRRSHAGTGLGRLLLEAVQDVARADSASAGVSLSTENPKNVELYRHFGYQVLGQANVAGRFETWGMFRPR
jgi:GNAT superfamily N-acetyltransferase